VRRGQELESVKGIQVICYHTVEGHAITVQVVVNLVT